MTVITPPGFLQAGSYSALMDRLHLNTARTLRDVSQAHRAMGGFFPDRYPSYSNPSAWNWTITACAGIVKNDFATDAGEYAFVNPSNVAGTVAASAPTTNRNDIIGFKVRDNVLDLSGFSDVAPLVLAGTPSAGAATDPAIPAGFIPVMRAVVAAGSVSPVLQDLRVRTTTGGAVLPVNDLTARAALGTQHAGQPVYRIDRGHVEYATGGGGWRIPTVVIATDAADLLSLVTFPYEGQLAYRVDTGRYYRRASSAWNPVTGYMHCFQQTGATQNVANNTPTALTFTGEIQDDFSGHDTAVNPSRYTPPVAGVYKCRGLVSFTNTAAGMFTTQFRKNGLVVLGASPYESKLATNQAFAANTARAEGTFTMNGTTDYIELWTNHLFGGLTATFANATDQHSYMIVERLG